MTGIGPNGELEARALQNLRQAYGQPDLEFGGTLEPMVFNPMALGGTRPVFWSAYLREVREISIPVSHASTGHISLASDRGALIMTLSGIQGYAFYIEADIVTPKPQTQMHWDATFAENPVFGMMTRVGPGSTLHYFGTPFSTRPEDSHFQISQDQGAAGEAWILKEVRMLGFLPR